MKKIFPSDITSTPVDDDIVRGSTGQSTRPRSSEQPIRGSSTRPSTRTRGADKVPTKLNTKRRQIQSDDNMEFETGMTLDDGLEETRGIAALTVGDGSEFSKITEGNMNAIARLNYCMVDHFVALSKRNDKNEEVDLPFVEQLLSAGANVNCKDVFGQTVMHEIIRCWEFDVYTWFVEHQADIYAADDHGVTLLHVAAGNDRVDILKDLMKRMKDQGEDNLAAHIQKVTKQSNENILHFAAKYDNSNCIEHIHIEDPSLIEGKDFMGRTPLMLAAELDRSEAARELLSHSANPSVKDNYGMSCLALMVEKMPQIGYKALNFFVHTHRSKRQQLFYLKHLEPTVDQVKSVIESNNQKDKPDRENRNEDLAEGVGLEYAMSVAVDNQQLKVIQHPVMRKLIDVKWDQYGRRGAWKELFIAFLLVFFWTWVAVQNKVYPYIYCWAPYDPGNKYYNGMDVFRIIMMCSACCYNVFTVFREIKEFNKSRKLTNDRRKFKQQRLQKNIEMEHPRWPDNKKYWEGELQELDEGGSSLQIYFSDGWNILDWIVYVMLVTLNIMHLIDWLVIGNAVGVDSTPGAVNATSAFSWDNPDGAYPQSLREQTCGRPHLTCEIIHYQDSDAIYTKDGRNLTYKQIYTAFLHAPNSGTCLSDWYNRLFSIAIMFLWLRLFKSLQAFRALGPLIMIFAKVITDITKFLCLYLVVFLAFTFSFWIMYGGVGIQNMETYDQLAMTIFRMWVVDEYPFEDMWARDFIMCYILVVLNIFICAIMFMNLMIALLSDSFQRIYDNSTAAALLQQAEEMCNIERYYMRDVDKVQFAETLSTHNPLKEHYDDDDEDADDNSQDDMQKASVQSLAILERLEEKLDDEEDESHPLQSRHTQQQKQSKEIVTLTSKVNSLTVALSNLHGDYKTTQQNLDYILHQLSDISNRLTGPRADSDTRENYQ